MICEEKALVIKELKKKLEDKLEAFGFLEHTTMYCLENQNLKTTADLIRDFLNSGYKGHIDFMFVGNRGADLANKDDKKYMGKVAT